MATITNYALSLNKKKNGKKLKVALVGTGFEKGPNPPATTVVIRLPADHTQPVVAEWSGTVVRVWDGGTRARAEVQQMKDLPGPFRPDDTGDVSITVDNGAPPNQRITVRDVDLYEEP